MFKVLNTYRYILHDDIWYYFVGFIFIKFVRKFESQYTEFQYMISQSFPLMESLLERIKIIEIHINT